MHNRRPSPSLKQHGFTYTEVLLSAVLLAVLVVPALQALQSGIAGGATQSVAERSPILSAKMEEVLSNPFSELYAETYKSACKTASNPNCNSDCNLATSISCKFPDPAAPDFQVVLYRYDASTKALSANDTGLLYVSVYYSADGSANALNTLAGRWW